jgi:transposase
MASARRPEEFFDAVAHLLPPEPPVGPKGGRPRVGHRVVVRVIWSVLTTGARGEDVPPQRGCSGRTAHRRLRDWEEAGAWGRLHADLLRLRKRAGELDTDTATIAGVTVRAFGGGEATGPSPVDRRKSGTRHTLMVDPSGVPLAIRTAGADASDHHQIIPPVLKSPEVGGKPGRPKELPDDLDADRGYDSEGTRESLRWPGIEPHIAKRRAPHGSGRGKIRRVVERTIAWLKGLRRLRVRYDRLGVMIDAWTTLAASVICYRILHHDAM